MDEDDPPMKAALAIFLIGASACSEATETVAPYATSVVSFTPGPGAGYGADSMPGVVLGPPMPLGLNKGATDVVSLGVGGEIVLDLGEEVFDQPGADLIVFENPFIPRRQPDTVFAEYGEVSVSRDGQTWSVFPCEPPDRIESCAGWRPGLAYDPEQVIPLDPVLTGGDPLDFKTVGIDSARFVRIRDLSESGADPSAGFDLDAVGYVLD